ncbi:hypothetical protein H8N01_15235 [Streptomyces sp. AC536]|uniref:hypothetical protein n=1 Tax=Streptomyces buecherae TaxID=2763006 RepID=UPI00164E58E5|nr:hypothetical protein [Streptomyces buecherae]MBC3983878.1 hypothetical protein [Streptomyces buecherae]QNJ41930.1 hypothetical protein H7H31_20735 [Streptomyces buecherae]
MLKFEDKQHLSGLIGGGLATAEWCKIGPLPKPPPDVHEAAGNGPLRPAFVRPLGIAGYVLAAPVWLVVGVAGAIEALFELVFGVFTIKKNRRLNREAEQRKAEIAAHGLNEVFDGDWNAAAGQLLLRWYSQSSHPKRLVLIAPGRIVLAGPPKRVTLGALDESDVLYEIPGDQAVIEDPLNGRLDTDKFRIRFSDGSWIVLEVTDRPSGIHARLKTMAERGGDNPDGLPVVVGPRPAP